MDFYRQLLNERQNWIPVEMPSEPIKSSGSDGVKETLGRVIALSLYMEDQVGAYIGQATRSELNLPDSAITLLKSNIKDEKRHERQFELAAIAYPVSKETMLEAQAITHWWNVNSDHTLSKAKEIETGIFIVAQAILRYFGGQSLDRMAADISLDEWRHLQTNWSVCEDLGLTSSFRLNQLRIDTLEWLVSGLAYPGVDSNFWRRQSDAMVENGEAPEMDTLFRNVPVPHLSFFEVSNSHISFYG